MNDMSGGADSGLRALPIDLARSIERRGRAGWAWRMEVLVKALLFPRIRAIVYYRLSQSLARRGLLPVAYFLQSRTIRSAGTEISPLAEIGPGLCLMHSVGIVVGPQVRVGRGLRLYHGVTLGDGATPGQPTIGDDVTIGAGSCVLGGVTVGNRVVIGANSVVTKDVADDSVAMGAPAKARPRTDRHLGHQGARPGGSVG